MKKENQIYCNKCGKKMTEHAEGVYEDFLHVEKIWGYFSEKDGEHHSFDLCETCYDKIMQSFARETEITEATELL